MKKLKDVSKATGLSRRMIQEYEKSGLVDKPKSKNKYGHLQYDEEEIRRLWQLCFYKEIGYDHNKIKEIENSMEDASQPAQTLEEAIRLLEQKKERLENLIKIANMMKETEAGYDFVCEIAQDKGVENYEDTFDTLCAMADGFEHLMALDDDIVSDEFDDLIEDFTINYGDKDYSNMLEIGADIWKEYLEEDFLKVYDYIEELGRKGVMPDDLKLQGAIQSLVDKMVEIKLTSYKGAGLFLLTMAECFISSEPGEKSSANNMFKEAIMVYMEKNRCEE